MKTKKLIIALLALGAYFTSNAQTWAPNLAPTASSTQGAIMQFPSLDQSTTLDGITWYAATPQAYGIFKTAGGWASSKPYYPQLQINWVTGTVLNGGTDAKNYPNAGTQIQPTGGPTYINCSPLPTLSTGKFLISSTAQYTDVNIGGNTYIGNATTNRNLNVTGTLTT